MPTVRRTVGPYPFVDPKYETDHDGCLSPEAKAREILDQKLELAGWAVQDYKKLTLGAALGVAIREYPTDTGPADYLLFLNREPVGIVEAKKDEAGETFTEVENPTGRYAKSTLK